MRTTFEIFSALGLFLLHVSLILSYKKILTNSGIKMAKRFTQPNSNSTRFVIWAKIVAHS